MIRILSAFTRLIHRQIPCYLYRQPGQACFCWGCQLTEDIVRLKEGALPDHSGFIMAPFTSADGSEAFFLRADRSGFFTEADEESVTKTCRELEDILRTLSFSEKAEISDVPVANRAVYEQQCSDMIDAIRGGEVHKAILSRVIRTESCSRKEGVSLFFSLAKQYASAFVFLVNAPGITCWAGATPETLLSAEEDGFRTMSLAGTAPWEEGISGIIANWGDKEIEEQAFVTAYVEQVLDQRGITYEKGELEVKRAARMAHLLTRFFIPKPLTRQQVVHLLDGLHPTPAVCGVPRDAALQLISRIELHHRSYYAGYLGPFRNEAHFALYVNLRSIRLLERGGLLYVGGGITAASDPKKEWDETCIKARTILDAIRE